MEIAENYSNYLENLKKDELNKIVKDYHEICDIYDFEQGKNITKKNKKEIIDYITYNINNYIPSLIKLLDKNDYEILKNIIKNYKKLNNECIKENKQFFDYLISKQILFVSKTTKMPKDIYNLIKATIIDKSTTKEITKNNYLYDLAKGLVIAYGVIDKKMFVDKLKKVDLKALLKIEYYYKKTYIITKDMVITKKITNKEKTKKYLNNTVCKEFKNKELINLARLKYHHNLKSYKKLLKTLKNNYVFKTEDINFIDKELIIPYLYNSLSEEDSAYKKMLKKVDNLFEFNNDKLKNKIIKLIIDIRNNFPIWEYRGFSKSEV